MSQHEEKTLKEYANVFFNDEGTDYKELFVYVNPYLQDRDRALIVEICDGLPIDYIVREDNGDDGDIEAPPTMTILIPSDNKDRVEQKLAARDTRPSAEDIADFMKRRVAKLEC